MILKKLDQWLLGQFQKVADFIQSTVGGDNFLCARCLYWSSFPFSVFVFTVCRASSTAHGKDAFEGFRFTGLVLWLVALGIIGVFGKAGEILWRANPETKNPNEVFLSALRIVHTFFTALASYTLILSIAVGDMEDLKHQVLHRIDSLILVSYLYFASCTPKPPKPKEVKVDLTDFAPEGA